MRFNDAERTRFRRPLGLLIIGYKAALGLAEAVIGALLAVPSFDPQATFARLAAEELGRTRATSSWRWSLGICLPCCTTVARSPSA